MQQTAITIHDRKDFLFMQIVTSRKNFLYRLIDLSTTVKQLHRHIRLTSEARLD